MVKTVSRQGDDGAPVCISIGVIAWNEEEAIGAALGSIFQQSLFAELARRHRKCEIICVANGCTDRTPAVAAGIFAQQRLIHPAAEAFSCRVVHLPERGKNNAWNIFVHALSLKEAEVLFLMDGDIVLRHRDTLRNMYWALNDHPDATIATDRPLKDLTLKEHKSFREKVSLATSRMTQSAAAQLTGQLYCIRSAVARNIFLPRDLVACEDGFIKSLACTDFLTRDICIERLVHAPDASHVFEAYTSFGDILRNQKRQMIGQTIVHILVDDYLKNIPPEEKWRLAESIQDQEECDPDWLKRLIAAHLQKIRFFWRLFPNLLGFRFQRLAGLRGREKLLHFPTALLGFAVALAASRMAYQFLKQGSTEYWPDTRSPHLREVGNVESKPAEQVVNNAV